MKALTLWQPWASLVVSGCKPYEFRKWRAPASVIGQRIVIHASARKPDLREVEQLLRLLRAGGRYAAQTCLAPIDEAIALLELGSWPLAAGLGTAIVGDPRSGIDIGVDFGAIRVNDSSRDYHANWGWPMLEIERWPEPIEMRGAQGLWTWPTPGAALL
ncbi:ASCH domain-containing protein [Sphingomonas koreensis]|uniref:ASCH domain-containing protein n=1 Tax=Sphingomonas koreensis TaxID=93064 RepID=UPI000F7E87DC|nr:ASCH domain-containing protein [Sphingomonas koreensis]MDC7808826.1 ASCH domain-containing protein [Sphingomonas koreensis]RSU98965.1 ASCH domain-containing protein [Sphingomonas koreensis]